MEDYELHNAREWDTDNKEPTPQALPRRGQRPNKPSRQSIPCLMDGDNNTTTIWRSRSDHRDSVRIPAALVLKERRHESIARKNGTFIFGQHRGGLHVFRTFGIKGAREAVAKTKQEIEQWIAVATSGQKSASSTNWAKPASLTPGKRDRAEREWKRDVKKHKFRQYPPPDMKIHVTGTFHWPADEYRPEEVLGTHYEALDPIRMECSCYVVFCKEDDLFHVMGEKKDVQMGLQRIRKILFQLAAWQMSVLRLCLLRWPKDLHKLPAKVYLQSYDCPTANVLYETGTKPAYSPRGCESEIMDITQITHARQMTENSAQLVKNAIMKTLPKLRYYRGNIYMRIRLGTFLVEEYMPPKDGLYELEEYKDMITKPQFRGLVTREFSDRSTKLSLLETLQSAADFVSPVDATINDLKEVLPFYATEFIFQDRQDRDFRLTVEWKKTSAGSAEDSLDVVSNKWTRVEKDADTATSILDISLTDLISGVAWQFDIKASPILDVNGLPPELERFEKKICHAPNILKSKTMKDLFVKYANTHGLKSIQKHTLFRYNINDSDFTLELVRFEDGLHPPSLTPRGASKTTRTNEPRWGINVYRQEWDTMFVQNERLKIGLATDWKVDIATWFPPGFVDDRDGWDHLMHKLGQIENFVEVRSAQTV